MKLADCLERYEYFSGKASDILRQLGFAGIALIWVFRDESQYNIPAELVPAGILIVIGLALDLLHYVTGTAIWGIYHRWKERHGGKGTEFLAPRSINWPTLTLFWGKVFAMIGAYFFIILFLFSEVL